MPPEKRHFFSILTDLDDFLGEFGSEGAQGIFEIDTGLEKIGGGIFSGVGDTRPHFKKLLFDRDG